MRTIQLLPMLLLGVYSLSAQEIYYTSFQNIIPDICLANSTPVIQYHPQGWVIYQTTNGNWDGPVDSSRCISAQAASGTYGVKIDLGQIDPAEPLFLRATAEELVTNASPAVPNELYNLLVCANLGSNPANQWLIGSNCAQDVCTGAFVGIAIPDSNGVPGAATRFHTSLAGASQSFYCFEACFPSEYFDEQRLRTLVLKFSFASMANLSGQFLHLSSVSVTPVYDTPGYITEVLAYPQQFANGVYTVNVQEAANNFPFNQNYLALYNPPAYPSLQHESYVEGRPVPNTNDPQTINLVVAQYQTLEIQPFTNFRGGKVLGSDSIRHTLNLVNNGGDLCMNYLDLIFGGNDEYQHGGGTISMHNGFSCMQFHDKSALRVKQDASLHYGNEGAGLLLLCAGSTIALEKNATLYFDGRLVLSECDDALPPQQIYMDLPPGARLVFSAQAHVTNQFSHNQQMRLRVRMLGGTLDDSALSIEDQAIIERVWPNPAPRLEDNLRLSPNPYASSLTLDYLSDQAEELRLIWTDLNGQVLQEARWQVQRGPNSWQPELPDPAGMYLLTVSGTHGKCTKKVVRIDP
ncbi:MAG: T9SS type A sorting domain-containing protein [Saprospiraceae bacterium]